MSEHDVHVQTFALGPALASKGSAVVRLTLPQCTPPSLPTSSYGGRSPGILAGGAFGDGEPTGELKGAEGPVTSVDGGLTERGQTYGDGCPP